MGIYGSHCNPHSKQLPIHVSAATKNFSASASFPEKRPSVLHASLTYWSSSLF